MTGTLTATGSTQSSGTSGQASITIDVGNNGTNDWTLVVGSNTTILPVAITGSLAIRINTATSAANGFASLSLNLSFRQTATTESFGAGCGQPLVLTSNQPRVGTSWQLTTSGVDAVSPIAATFFGARGPAVPMSAIGLDAPGCDVHLASALTTISGANVAGAAVVPVAIPNSATLVGIKLSAQSLCLTAANPAGLHSSNGLEGTIGW